MTSKQAITALEQNIKTGHWIDAIEPIPLEERDAKLGITYKNAGYKCSVCGAKHEEHRLSMVATKTNYCPNCGAKMTESEG